MKKLLSLFVLLSSCSLLKVVPENNLTPFPSQPNFVTVGDKPILEKQGDNYLVTSDFLKRATSEHQYLKSVLIWKSKNGIKE